MTPTPDLIDGTTLRQAWISAARHLHERAAAIDAINEYPVPDGDTGSNMAATLDRAVQSIEELDTDPTAAEVLKALARGALYGARGNSGVIYSQALKGLSNGVSEAGQLDAASLAAGMVEAAAAAYKAVANPVEGTMLTVLREAGDAARAAAANLPDSGRGQPCLGILSHAIRVAEEAEVRTQEQLPELTEAGLPDAGGEGVCTILRGLLAALTGQAAVEKPLPERAIAARDGHEADAFGFCTEFLVEGEQLQVDRIRELVTAGANSSVVFVGDEDVIRVHVHTAEPQALLESVGAFGKLSRVKVEDMAAQHERLVASGSGAGVRTALLALSPGPGFDRVFAEYGARTTPLGELTKPAAGDLARAADDLHVADVIILPNHKNVMLAAQQAAGITRCTLHVVPATNLAQGIAAAIELRGGEGLAENVRRMTAVLADVHCVEVTIASADRTADGVRVSKGQAIVLVDGRLVAAADDPLDALIEGLRQAGSSAELVTIFTGDGAPASDSELRERLEAAFEDLEIELLSGGQKLYPYIASVEG